VGIVGIGKLGQLHAAIYRQIPQVQLAGVYDIDHQKALQFCREWGVPCFEELESLLAAVDALSVTVPTTCHFEVTFRALEAGIHTFVEKPLADQLEEARQLVALAQRRGLTLQVGHIERFNPAFRALEGLPLEPKFIECHRLAFFDPRGTDVAVVLDLMIHDIDLVLTLVDSPIERIDANGVAVVSEQADIANARIQFQNGCVANLTASRMSLRKMRKMRLFQKDAYITMDFLLGQAEIYQLKDPSEPLNPDYLIWGEIQRNKTRKRIVYRKPQVEEKNALKLELMGFADAILTGSRPPVTGEEGLRALEVACWVMDRIEQQPFLTAG